MDAPISISISLSLQLCKPLPKRKLLKIDMAWRCLSAISHIGIYIFIVIPCLDFAPLSRQSSPTIRTHNDLAQSPFQHLVEAEENHCMLRWDMGELTGRRRRPTEQCD